MDCQNLAAKSYNILREDELLLKNAKNCYLLLSFSTNLEEFLISYPCRYGTFTVSSAKCKLHILQHLLERVSEVSDCANKVDSR